MKRTRLSSNKPLPHSPVMKRKSFGNKVKVNTTDIFMDENGVFSLEKVGNQLSSYLRFFKEHEGRTFGSKIVKMAKLFLLLHNLSSTINDASMRDDLPSLTKVAMYLAELMSNEKETILSLFISLALCEVFFIFRPSPPYNDDKKIEIFQYFLKNIRHITAPTGKVVKISNLQRKDIVSGSLSDHFKDSKSLSMLLLERIHEHRVFLIFSDLKPSTKDLSKEGVVLKIFETYFDILVSFKDKDIHELLTETLFELVCEIKSLQRYPSLVNLFINILTYKQQSHNLFRSIPNSELLYSVVMEIISVFSPTTYSFSSAFEAVISAVFLNSTNVDFTDKIDVVKEQQDHVLLNKYQTTLLEILGYTTEKYHALILSNALPYLSDQNEKVRYRTVSLVGNLLSKPDIVSGNFDELSIWSERVCDVSKRIRESVFDTLLNLLSSSECSEDANLKNKLIQTFVIKEISISTREASVTFLMTCLREPELVEKKFELADRLFSLIQSIEDIDKINSLMDNLTKVISDSNFKSSTYLLKRVPYLIMLLELDENSKYELIAKFYQFTKYKFKTNAQINCFQLLKLRVLDDIILQKSTAERPIERLNNFMGIFSRASTKRKQLILKECFEFRSKFRAILTKVCTIKLGELNRPNLFNKLVSHLWDEYLSPIDSNSPWLSDIPTDVTAVNLCRQLFELNGVDEVFQYLLECSNLDITQVKKVRKIFSKCSKTIKNRLDATKFHPLLEQIMYFLSLHTLSLEAIHLFFNEYVLQIVTEEETENWLEVASALLNTHVDLFQKHAVLNIETVSKVLREQEGFASSDSKSAILSQLTQVIVLTVPNKPFIELKLQESNEAWDSLEGALNHELSNVDNYIYFDSLSELASCVYVRRDGAMDISDYVSETFEQSLSPSDERLPSKLCKIAHLINKGYKIVSCKTLLKKIFGFCWKIAKAKISTLCKKIHLEDDKNNFVQLLKLSSICFLDALLQVEDNSFKSQKQKTVLLFRTIMKHEGNPWKEEELDSAESATENNKEESLFTKGMYKVVVKSCIRRCCLIINKKSYRMSQLKIEMVDYALLFQALSSLDLLDYLQSWTMDINPKLYYQYTSLSLLILFIENKSVLSFDTLNCQKAFTKSKCVLIKLINNFHKLQAKEEKIEYKKLIHKTPEYMLTYMMYLLSHLPWLMSIKEEEMSLVEFKRKHSDIFFKLKQTVTKVTLQFVHILRDCYKQAKNEDNVDIDLMTVLSYKMMTSKDILYQNGVLFEAIGEILVNVLTKKVKGRQKNIKNSRANFTQVTLPCFFEENRAIKVKPARSDKTSKHKSLQDIQTDGGFTSEAASIVTESTTYQRNKKLSTEARVEEYKRRLKN